MRALVGILALLLVACAPNEGTAPGSGNQPHIPPPGFPTGTAVGPGDRVCSAYTSEPLASCAATEFCFIPEGQYCGAADYPGICKTKPEICTQDYAPVCGCDGKTYPNTCGAHAAGVSVADSGECR